MSFFRSFTHTRGCRQLVFQQNSVRYYASLNAAIGRGLRDSRSSKTPNLNTRSSNNDRNSGLYPKTGGNNPRRREQRESRTTVGDDDDDAQAKAIVMARRERALEKSKTSQKHQYSDEQPVEVKAHVKVPASMPLTHPASEFLYGAHAVEAALRCNRRKLYKLYIYQAVDELLGPRKIAIRKLALAQGVPVKMAFGYWYKLFDKVSSGRAHNDFILEASHLPLLPVKGLYPVLGSTGESFGAELAPQSREEAEVNGASSDIPIVRSYQQSQNRYPVVLLLDGIVDPGNLGAIIRSAYYLGIDAIVFAGRNSAPLSPVAIKSSSGAAENMTFLRAISEHDFIKRSKGNGWKFYAADAPSLGTPYAEGSVPGVETQLVNQSPSVLMLGSEEAGLIKHIRKMADSVVSIPSVRNPVAGVSSDPARVDSLNVSVAAALLMEKFLQIPVEVTPGA